MNGLILTRNWLAVIASLVCALPLVTGAAPPNKVTVTAAVPSEAYQGEELAVVVSGSGFDAGTSVSYLVTGTTDASQVDVLSVQYISSSELRTYIRPKANALTTDYDIEARTSTGRKGKGTTLFRVKYKGQPPPPPPTTTEPAARYWHGFTDNGGATPATSRLYVIGGDGGYENGWQTMFDHWYYSVATGSWYPAPTGSSPPDPRKHMGFSCGGGRCVWANGYSNNGSLLKETWVYTESNGIWSQLNCKRYLCPSARARPAMAFDSVRGYHLLFGGMSGSTTLDDTYTFSNSTQRWTRQSPKVSPSARHWAAATFAGGPVNRVVLFGGEFYFTEILCDMWSWNGNNWEEIVQINPSDGPCLDSHSMAWDGTRLVVTGGYVDHYYGDLPNYSVWTFTFTADGRAGTWSWYPHWSDYFGQCAGSGVIRPGARMAFDRPSGSFVFFGGVENVEELGPVAYDDLSVCQ